MASLRKRENVGKEGTFEIQFWNECQQRKTITLSCRKYSEDVAEALRNTIATLIYEKVNDVAIPHRRTQQWVEDAPLEIREKLARVGLCLVSSRHTVKELWNTFLNRYEFKTEGTRKGYHHARERFALFFRPNELISRLTQDRMRQWKEFLLDGRYAVATVAGTIEKTKAVFNWAKDQKWITKSPMDGVGAGSYRNEDNDRFITQVEHCLLLDACQCQEWRTIIALARMGGLRPCEIMVLRWLDIDRENDWFSVHSPKTKGRNVPLFPEVDLELQRLQSLPGNADREYVINRFVNRETYHLGQSFDQIAKRSGIGTIPRPFDNMRMSRSNEIRRLHGEKLENLWIGHSAKVAKKYYHIATADDYAVAVGKVVNNAVSRAEARHLPEVPQEWRVVS
jgi:integrase